MKHCFVSAFELFYRIRTAISISEYHSSNRVNCISVFIFFQVRKRSGWRQPVHKHQASTFCTFLIDNTIRNSTSHYSSNIINVISLLSCSVNNFTDITLPCQVLIVVSVNIYNSIYYYYQWLCDPVCVLLQLSASESYTPSVGLLSWGISPSQSHRTTQTHNKQGQISMSRFGFELRILVFEQVKRVYTLYHSATETGLNFVYANVKP
jgi:hypothetical protein